MKRKILFLMIALSVSLHFRLNAQEVAIKTNVLSDAFLNVNAGIEVSVAPRWSIDLSGDFNGWNLSHGRRGWCSPKPVIGSVKPLADILSVCMPSPGSITWDISTLTSSSLVPISPISRPIATKDG